jgi:hypothetical protein
MIRLTFVHPNRNFQTLFCATPGHRSFCSLTARCPPLNLLAIIAKGANHYSRCHKYVLDVQTTGERVCN